MGLWLRGVIAVAVFASLETTAGTAGAATVSVQLLQGALSVSADDVSCSPTFDNGLGLWVEQLDGR